MRCADFLCLHQRKGRWSSGDCGPSGPKGLRFPFRESSCDFPVVVEKRKGPNRGSKIGAKPEVKLHVLVGRGLFADDDDGAGAKDICPRPNQLCLDDLEFVLRVSFNRRGDAVFGRYILGHFPCPPRKAL